MPAQIPSAIMGGSPARQKPATELLLALAQALMGAGAQYAGAHTAPPTAAEQQLAGNQSGALTMLQNAATTQYPQQPANADAAAAGVPQMPQQQPPASAQAARQLYGAATTAAGLGNANVGSADAMQSMRAQAPAMMAQIAPMQAEEATAAATQQQKSTDIEAALASVPQSLKPATRSVLLSVRAGNSPEAALALARSANMVPPTQEEELQLSVHRAELQHYTDEHAMMLRDQASMASFAQQWHMDPAKVTPATFAALFQTRDPYELRTRLALQYAQMIDMEGKPVYPGGAAITQADSAIRQNIDQTWGLPGPGVVDKVGALKTTVAVDALDGMRFGLKSGVPLPQARATAYKKLLEIYAPSINDGSLSRADLRASVQAALDSLQSAAAASAGAASTGAQTSLQQQHQSDLQSIRSIVAPPAGQSIPGGDFNPGSDGSPPAWLQSVPRMQGSPLDKQRSQLPR